MEYKISGGNMKKNYLKCIFGALLSLNLIITPVSADTVKSSVGIGWVQQNGAWTYVKSDGSNATGWIQDGVDWYYFWSNGQMATGWVQAGGNWYYMTGSGAMASNTVVDGYYLNASGAWTSRPSGEIRTGAQIKEKVSSLGCVQDKYGSLKFNPNSNSDDDEHDYMGFGTWSDDRDMNLTIYRTNADIDNKIRTILNWILPTKGNTLYSTIDVKGLQSQTLELDGRTVIINVQPRYLSITFRPIK